MRDFPPHHDSASHKGLRRQRRHHMGSDNEETTNSGSNAGDINVGQRLRELRMDKGFSLRALASQSQLNVNTLSLIENGKTSPSVSTLQQLAQTLGVPITSFFETVSPKQRTVYQKNQQHPIIPLPHGTLEDLGAGIAYRMAEPLLVTLEPGADSGPDPIVHTGCEFVYCLAGHLTYKVNDQTYILEPGDSLLFEAHQPHRWINDGAIPSRSLLVLCPSDQQDHPTESHFTPESPGK